MPRTKHKFADAAESIRPYLERMMTDEKLRHEVLRAFGTARELYEELVGDKNRPMTLASRVATDDDIRDKLRNAIDDLRCASDRLQEKRERSGGRAPTVLIVGITLESGCARSLQRGRCRRSSCPRHGCCRRRLPARPLGVVLDLVVHDRDADRAERGRDQSNDVSGNPYDCGVTLAGHHAGIPLGNPATGPWSTVAPTAGGVFNNLIRDNELMNNGVIGQGGGVILIESPEVGPFSSLSKMPPLLPVTTLPVTVELSAERQHAGRRRIRLGDGRPGEVGVAVEVVHTDRVVPDRVATQVLTRDRQQHSGGLWRGDPCG